MKRKKLVFLGVLMLFVAPVVLAENQKKEVPIDEAMKYFCATWINPTYYERPGYSGKIVVKDGTIEWYKDETSQSLQYTDRYYKVEKGWIDKDGNLWLNVLADYFDGQKLWKKYLLAKISDDGNTLEFAYDWKVYPTVDPETWPYYIMNKK